MTGHSASTVRRPVGHVGRLRRAAAIVVPVTAVLALALTAGPAEAQTANTTPPPFATGTLASIVGSTLKVQARSGTTSTVVVTKSTALEKTTAATASNITKGVCVRAIGTGSATTGIQAATVLITTPTSKGVCTQPGGRGGNRGAAGNGGNGRFGTGNPNGGPTGNGTPPSSLPNGSAGTRPTNIATTFGSVTNVAGDQVTVKETVTARSTTSTTKKSTSTTKKAKTTTQNVTITLTSSTTETQTIKAVTADLVTGVCVTANGTADSLGTITATTVAISQPQNGTCGFGGLGGRGFGGGGFGGRGGAGGAQPATST